MIKILKFDNSRIAKNIYGNFSQCTLAELFQSPLDANGHVQWGTSRTKSFALHIRGSLWICSAVRLLNGHVNWAKNRNLQKKERLLSQNIIRAIKSGKKSQNWEIIFKKSNDFPFILKSTNLQTPKKLSMDVVGSLFGKEIVKSFFCMDNRIKCTSITH